MLTTLWVTVVAFALAALLGLVVALGRVSRLRVVREVATFYVEIVRGIPVLVLLFYVAFVGAPQLVRLWNRAFDWPIGAGVFPALSVRDFDLTWRAIFALTVSYSAYLAEIFRAGIEAVPKGHLEAAWSLGLRRWQDDEAKGVPAPKAERPCGLQMALRHGLYPARKISARYAE